MTFKAQVLQPLYHYLLVMVGVAAVLLLEIFVPGLASGLTATPFILVTTTAAMFGNFGSGILSILLSGVAVSYVVPPMGLGVDASTIFKTLEFMLITTIIFLISWHSRTLYANNVVLKEMTKRLQEIASGLQTQASGDKKRLQQLNEVNRKLVSIVDQFIKDDEYWARKITTPFAPLPKSISNKHDNGHGRLGKPPH